VVSSTEKQARNKQLVGVVAVKIRITEPIPKRQSGDLKPPLIDLEVNGITTGRKQEKSVQRERLSEADYMYCVYWIRLENHTDVYKEGYVGITSNFTERIKSHKKNNRVSHLTNATKKYGWKNLVIDILFINLTQQQALDFEASFRPSCNIGWNSQQGGILGVEKEWYQIEENRNKHSRATSTATKIGIAAKDTIEARSKRAKDNWKQNRESYKDISKGSKNPKAKLVEEQVQYIKYTLIPANLHDKEIASLYNVKPYVINFIRTGKNWSYI
jgi:predicted GIY-YIG superfamily endonuclease